MNIKTALNRWRKAEEVMSSCFQKNDLVRVNMDRYMELRNLYIDAAIKVAEAADEYFNPQLYTKKEKP
jgi:hypothetical protein